MNSSLGIGFSVVSTLCCLVGRVPDGSAFIDQSEMVLVEEMERQLVSGHSDDSYYIDNTQKVSYTDEMYPTN